MGNIIKKEHKLNNCTNGTQKPETSINYPTTEETIEILQYKRCRTFIEKIPQKIIHFEYEDLQSYFSEKLIYYRVKSKAKFCSCVTCPSGAFLCVSCPCASYPDDETIAGILVGKIGSGRTGDVFVGFHSNYGHVAIKKLRMDVSSLGNPEQVKRVFEHEIDYISRLRHKNLVSTIGISIDGPYLCIVSEYIDGGSLRQNLAMKILTEKQKLKILTGIAEGLKYIHQGFKENLEIADIDAFSNIIHNQMKSSNILLTRDYEAKMCNFGLSIGYRDEYSGLCSTHPMGADPYMAPEEFSGVLTKKIDSYRFGIVLLETLTNLTPIVCDNDEYVHIKDYIEEKISNNDISALLDTSIGTWMKGEELYKLAIKCLERKRLMRPSSEELCQILHRIQLD